eukprot:COSAG01_NODE_8049_length_2940_cov_28.152763_5_plen_89_part_00
MMSRGRYFILFLIYVVIGESYGLTLLISRAIWCTSYPDEESCGAKGGAASESELSQFAVVACVVRAGVTVPPPPPPPPLAPRHHRTCH